MLDESRYSLQRLIDNVNLLTPELLDKINRIVVECGHKLVGKKDGGSAGRKLRNVGILAIEGLTGRSRDSRMVSLPMNR